MTVKQAKVEQSKLSQFRPASHNANKHTERGLKLLADAMNEVGYVAPITVAADGETLDGSARLETAFEKFGDEAIVIRHDGTKPIVMVREDIPNAETPEAKRIAYGANRIGQVDLSFDPAQIAEDLAAGVDLSGLWTDLELKELFADLPTGEAGDAPPAIDRAAELQQEWQTATGQLWRIGEHRLLVGDSTRREDVERVMGGERADLCLTDPPYGIDLEYDTFKDTAENVEGIARLWLPIVRDIARVVCFSCGITRQWLYPEPSWVLCWFYGGGQLRSPWGFNCWQPFLCYGKDPSLAVGRGARPDAVDLNVPANSSDIDHPCPKPLTLIEWLINRLSFADKETVLDPFLGSGTTMVACQNLGRKCRGIEISPSYVAVCLERMKEAFGLRGELVDG